MERSLEDDGLIVALPQCQCDSEDCKKRDDCVLQPAGLHFFPELDMRTGDETKTDPNCYGDCTIVCTDYQEDKDAT